ncbi:hypothetical protein EJ04DRAFT_570253 [Polyplosphaeria fusca]|uniref:Uncharacterized protein n=1 Tax=Polyplosphaeria fusca TaxID=682080 RepID=A0A9P4UT95_9PLEO|nr:hypothetical protein EJ04DRAFT_570253 [Polyplosphaeria fusca]
MVYLPDELIDMIIFYAMSGSRNHRKLVAIFARLSLVSKQFRRIILPQLYSNIHGGPKGINAKLIRAFMTQPSHGRYVQNLDAKRSPLTDIVPSIPYPNFVQTIETHNTHLIASFKPCFQWLPHLLPNLTHLDVCSAKHPCSIIPTKHRPYNDRPWLLLMSPLSPHSSPHGSPPFQSLTHLSADISGLPLVDLWPAFQLPAISTMTYTGGTLLMPSGTAPFYFFASVWARILDCPVKHLSFRHAVPPADLHTLGWIARSAALHLESLAFIGSRKKPFGAHMHRSIIWQFQQALRNPRFRRLEMWDERVARADKYEAIGYRSTMRKLLRLSAVREMVDQGLCGVVGGYAYGVCRMLRDIGVDVGGYPSLEKVVAEVQVADLLDADAMKDIHAVFTGNGIEFELRRKKGCAWELGRIIDEVMYRLPGSCYWSA